MNIFKTLPLLLVAFTMISLTSCGDDEPENTTAKYAGVYSGQMEVTVGGQFTYSAPVDVTILSKSDETITVEVPSYALSGTMMGNLTLGSLTVSGLRYDAQKDAYTRNYGGQGIIRHFKAMQGPAVTMEGDYPLNDPSEISIKFNSDNSLTLSNSYKLGEMPFSLSAKFTGSK